MSAVRLRAKPLLRAFQFGMVWTLAVCSSASESIPTSPGAILQELRSFGTVATILHVAAHPDDENTALITYFARGRGYRTAYLSLTRGDGGQNEIGPEFDEKLGVARTQELLAARRLDGGRQFFTRAIDFGFSKTPEETLRFWDREEVLSDVVRIVRQFRPDVIVTRFPIPPGSGGHGHHTASGILGVEAFKLAGDPKAYPEQLAQGLSPWQPKRVVWNGGGGGRGGGSASSTNATFTMDIGGTDPVSGESFGAIAGRSRAMHITQGFSAFGGRGGGGPNVQTFTVFGGEPAFKDLFDGIDTTWARVPGGSEIGTLVEQALTDFKIDDPSASVPAILTVRSKLQSLPLDPVIRDKRAQLDRILQACLGLSVESLADKPEVVQGGSLRLRHSISIKSSVPVRWAGLRAANLERPGQAGLGQELRAGQPLAIESVLRVPSETAVTNPYWLREEGSSGVFRVDNAALIGMPENPPSFPIEFVFEVGGQKLTVTDEPVCVERRGGKERLRRVDVIPPVYLRFTSEVSLLRPGTTKAVSVEVTAARSEPSGTVQLELPDGWTASPKEQAFHLAQPGDKARVSFNLTAPATPSTGRLRAHAKTGGQVCSTQRIEINYSHVPLMLLQPPARARLVCADIQTRGKKVGYLPGAGDSTAQALEELGYDVTVLAGPDLTPEKLQGLDAVIVGVRAFNERSDLSGHLTNVFNYVENGGTVLVQYNRPNGLKAQPLGPYSLSIQGPAPQLRVTDERAPVTLLSPAHAALTAPNRIGPSDFEGWVQERGAYFPSSWEKGHYAALLAMSDPGERPLESGLLVAKHGRGYYVYTGLAFFRQLPAGVPGAYRLFANLVSLGK